MAVRDDPPPPAAPPAPALTPEFIQQLSVALLPALSQAVISALPKPPAPPTPPEPPAPPKPEGGEDDLKDLPPALRAEIIENRQERRRNQERIATLEATNANERAEREKRERQLQISGELETYQFQSPTAKNDFMERVLGLVKVDSHDKSLTVNGLPIKNAVKAMLESDYAYALKRGEGGTGARPGGDSQSSVPQLEDIKAGMSEADRKRVLGHMAKVNRQWQGLQ